MISLGKCSVHVFEKTTTIINIIVRFITLLWLLNVCMNDQIHAHVCYYVKGKYIIYPGNIAKFLPPASAVEVKESVPFVCACVSVCPHSHD